MVVKKRQFFFTDKLLLLRFEKQKVQLIVCLQYTTNVVDTSYYVYTIRYKKGKDWYLGLRN